MGFMSRNRNKPCICNSGKKFKNCCALKATGYMKIGTRVVKIWEVETELPQDIKTGEELQAFLKKEQNTAIPSLVKPYEWWQNELKTLNFFAFTNDVLDKAKTFDNRFIALKNDIQCFLGGEDDKEVSG